VSKSLPLVQPWFGDRDPFANPGQVGGPSVLWRALLWQRSVICASHAASPSPTNNFCDLGPPQWTSRAKMILHGSDIVVITLGRSELSPTTTTHFRFFVSLTWIHGARRPMRRRRRRKRRSAESRPQRRRFPAPDRGFMQNRPSFRIRTMASSRRTGVVASARPICAAVRLGLRALNAETASDIVRLPTEPPAIRSG
jgi:hypothetical protein